MTITRFEDRHTIHGPKTEYDYIYIEASFQASIDHFKERFGRNPRSVTCECCGMDYNIETHSDLIQATGFERDCRVDGGTYVDESRDSPYEQYIPLDEWLDREDVCYIESDDI
jgi:hypothetical protein